METLLFPWQRYLLGIHFQGLHYLSSHKASVFTSDTDDQGDIYITILLEESAF